MKTRRNPVIAALAAAALAVGLLASVPLLAGATPIYGKCADWQPNGMNVLLCNLGSIKPPVIGDTTTPTPTPTTPGANPFIDAVGCGATLPKTGGGTWECTFADNFDGDELNRSRWAVQTSGFQSGTATHWTCYVDNPANIAVSNHSLKLNMIELPAAQACPSNKNKLTKYTSASLTTFNLWSQAYGRFEAKYRNTAVANFGPDSSGIDKGQPGLQETFWLWPDVRKGAFYANGDEIDIVETYSYKPTLAIPYLHYGLMPAKPGVNTAWNCLAPRGVYNTYTLEWKPGRAEIFVNGQSCLVNTSTNGAFKKTYIIALTQLMGASDNELQPGLTPMPATMEVDYVRAWK